MGINKQTIKAILNFRLPFEWVVSANVYNNTYQIAAEKLKSKTILHA